MQRVGGKLERANRLAQWKAKQSNCNAKQITQPSVLLSRTPHFSYRKTEAKAGCPGDFVLSATFKLWSFIPFLLETHAHHHPDYQLRHLLGNINLKEQHGRGLPCDTQIRRQEWDLDAVDRMIVELRRQLHTGDADGLIIIQATDEAIISLVYPSGSLILRPMLMKLGRMRGIWLREIWYLSFLHRGRPMIQIESTFEVRTPKI